MATCRLEIFNAKFRSVYFPPGRDLDFDRGLEELRDKVAVSRDACQWFSQPMPGYPELQNKIWKWDFRPFAAGSATRPAARLLAWVPDPEAPDPIPAIPFLVIFKADMSGGYSPKFVAKELKKFLEKVIVITDEERFHHQPMSGSRVRSTCYSCLEFVIESADEAEIELAESAHECPTQTPT